MALDMKGLEDIKKSTEDIAELLRKIGFAVSNEVRDAARKKSKGGQFWHGVAASVSYLVEGKGLKVGAGHVAAAHKHFGGVISAPSKYGKGRVNPKTGKPVQFLSIPISQEAKGKNISDFREDEIVFIGRVVYKASLIGGKRNPESVLEPLFVLKKSVNQKAEPWFPTPQRIEVLVGRAIESYLKGKNK